MKILSRYILGEFGRMFALTLSAFVVIFLLGDFIEKVDDYIEHKATVEAVLYFTMYQVPKIFFLMTPVAVLLSTLLVLGMLSRNSEVLAMKSSGIPLYTIVAPIFAAAAVLSLLLFWAGGTVIPYCNTKAEQVKRVKIEKRPMRPALKHDKLWFRGPRGEIINIGLVEYEGDLPACYGVTFYRLGDGFDLVQRVDAERMDWVDEEWLLKKGVVYNFTDRGRIGMKKFDEMKVDLPERPEDFKQTMKLSEELTFTELKNYISRLRSEGYNPVKYEVDLYEKVAFTLASMIMVIVAIPFSLRSSRSGGMALSVGICIVVAISYWLLHSFSISLGHAGRFPPIFSAWLSNLIFGAVGLYMTLQADR